MRKLIGIYMVLLGFMVLLSLQAHAEVMIEPFVGYDQATLAAKDLSSADVGVGSGISKSNVP